MFNESTNILADLKILISSIPAASLFTESQSVILVTMSRKINGICFVIGKLMLILSFSFSYEIFTFFGSSSYSNYVLIIVYCRNILPATTHSKNRQIFFNKREYNITLRRKYAITSAELLVIPKIVFIIRKFSNQCIFDI